MKLEKTRIVRYLMEPIRMPRFAFLFLVMPLIDSVIVDAIGITNFGLKLVVDMAALIIALSAIAAYNHFWLKKGFRV